MSRMSDADKFMDDGQRVIQVGTRNASGRQSHITSLDERGGFGTPRLICSGLFIIIVGASAYLIFHAGSNK